MEIRVHFATDLADLIDLGLKTATTRRNRLGKTGDTFSLRGRTYIITSISRKSLGIVANHYHGAEGFLTTIGFIIRWKSLYPKTGYHPLDKVWYHTFRRRK